MTTLKRPCPLCQATTKPFSVNATLVIDTCNECAAYLFDSGELEKVVNGKNSDFCPAENLQSHLHKPCRNCNAIMAAYLLDSRPGEPTPPQIHWVCPQCHSAALMPLTLHTFAIRLRQTLQQAVPTRIKDLLKSPKTKQNLAEKSGHALKNMPRLDDIQHSLIENIREKRKKSERRIGHAIWQTPFVIALGLLLSQVSIFSFISNVICHEFGHSFTWILGGVPSIPMPMFALAFHIGFRSQLLIYIQLTLYLSGFFLGIYKNHYLLSFYFALFGSALFFLSRETLDNAILWGTLGGVLGEFFLSALLVSSFVLTLPQFLRWDFFRFPAAIFGWTAAFTTLFRWTSIIKGGEPLPTGSALGGGDADGDLGKLLNEGGIWTEIFLRHTFSRALGILTAVMVLSALAGLVAGALKKEET